MTDPHQQMDIDREVTREVDFQTTLILSILLGILGIIITVFSELPVVGPVWWVLLWSAFGNPLVLYRYGNGTVEQARYLALSFLVVTGLATLTVVLAVAVTGAAERATLVAAVRILAITGYSIGMTYCLYWWRIGILTDVLPTNVIKNR